MLYTCYVLAVWGKNGYVYWHMNHWAYVPWGGYIFGKREDAQREKDKLTHWDDDLQIIEMTTNVQPHKVQREEEAK